MPGAWRRRRGSEAEPGAATTTPAPHQSNALGPNPHSLSTVIVEQGIIAAGFTACHSVEEAVCGSKDGKGVAWIALADASFDELGEVARRLHLGPRALVELEERRRTPRAPRARIPRLDRGAHLILPGLHQDGTGGVRLRGQLELFATRESVAVLATDLPEHMQPRALRRQFATSLQEAREPTGGLVLGLTVSAILDWYERLLDLLEDESVRLADELFTNRREEELRRIYALSRPVHATAVAMEPLVSGFDELAHEADAALAVSLARPLRSEILYLRRRLERLEALLSSTQQSCFNLAQDEANRLMERQGDVTRQMSGYALLIAIPTIVFALYGTNFNHIPLLGKSWGYGVMLALTGILCLIAWWRLRRASWI
jgi:magnesium transporter